MLDISMTDTFYRCDTQTSPQMLLASFLVLELRFSWRPSVFTTAGLGFGLSSARWAPKSYPYQSCLFSFWYYTVRCQKLIPIMVTTKIMLAFVSLISGVHNCDFGCLCSRLQHRSRQIRLEDPLGGCKVCTHTKWW